MTDTAIDFINKVAAAQAGEAKDTLNNMLSAKAMEALDGKKQEIAQSIFNGVEAQPEVEEPTTDETEVEVQDSADAPVEEPTQEEE